MAAEGHRIMITGHRQVELRPFSLDDAALSPSEVIIQTEVSLLSGGTEGALFQGLAVPGSSPTPYPRGTGYAAIGSVLAAGAAAGVAPGQRVYSMSPHASFARVDAARTLCLPVPEELTPEEAVFARLITVPLASVRTARARAGDRAAVVGLGLVGNLGAQVLESAGLPTTGVDLVPERRALAERCGVTATVDPANTDAIAPDHTLVLEASGTAKGALVALALARLGGEISLVGTPWSPDATVGAAPFLEAIHTRYLTLRSGWEWQMPMHSTANDRSAVHQPGSVTHSTLVAFDLLRRRKVRVRELLTHRFMPADCQAAYDGALDRRGEQLGVIFDWR
jgi:2-desacetyl-2-hydroxyethyl bacteriochlorophyllide A dehydrogenase